MKREKKMNSSIAQWKAAHKVVEIGLEYAACKTKIRFPRGRNL